MDMIVDPSVWMVMMDESTVVSVLPEPVARSEAGCLDDEVVLGCAEGDALGTVLLALLLIPVLVLGDAEV